MSRFSTQAMADAVAAKEQLARDLRDCPGLTLIDIAAEASPGTTQKRLVVRVHLGDAARADLPAVPPEINGVPVRVMRGDYRLETPPP